MKTTTQPWRVVELPEELGFEIWTREDDTPGSRNNYAIATGIQDEREAVMLASAPRLLEEREALLATCQELLAMATELLPLAPNGCGWGQIALDNAREVIDKTIGHKPTNQAMDILPPVGAMNEEPTC